MVSIDSCMQCLEAFNIPVWLVCSCLRRDSKFTKCLGHLTSVSNIVLMEAMAEDGTRLLHGKTAVGNILNLRHPEVVTIQTYTRKNVFLWWIYGGNISFFDLSIFHCINLPEKFSNATWGYGNWGSQLWRPRRFPSTNFSWRNARVSGKTNVSKIREMVGRCCFPYESMYGIYINIYLDLP